MLQWYIFTPLFIPWAKGLVSIGSTAIYGSDSSVKVLDKLIDIMPELGNLDERPVITGYDNYFSEGDRACIEVIRSFNGNVFSLDAHLDSDRS